MRDERWRRVEELYHEALGVTAGARSEWLAAACGSDADLREDVEGLLHYDVRADRFLEKPALAVAAATLASDRRRNSVGRRLGGYEVVEFVGAGGMGDVYRAHDLRLRRDVALKVFENVVSVNALRRFEAEARAASLLNHPNIVTIFGVGEEGDTAYIAMELVRGRTLKALLGDRPLTMMQSLEIGVQLAEAIVAAHAAGIIHRDLKPENVMISPDGRVKVLDFGIAKLQRELSAAVDSLDEIEVGPVTEAGMLLGTIGYMSPEQARGLTVTPASDQFSFALICCEMLTGRRPFARGSRRETLDAVINEPAAVAELGVKPASVVAFLERCLAKEPGQRYAGSVQFAAEIRRLRDTATHESAGKAPTRRQLLALGAFAAAGAAVGFAGWRFGGRTPTVQSLIVLPFGNPGQDGATRYLCDGITETLIRRLAGLSSLRVIARATAFTFRDGAVDPRVVGQQLAVDAVLTGAVTRRGGRVLISAELVDSATGLRTWGEDFDRPATDVLAVQNEIARAIGESIDLPMTADERRRFLRTLTDDPVAYELFLQGVHHLRLGTEDDYLEARGLLTDATTRDPQFALALVTLASTHSVMAVDGYVRPADSWPQSEVNVAHALAIDPDLPDAHAEAASSAFFYRWDRQAADRHWKTAFASRKGEVQSELLGAYALQQWASGHLEAALQTAKASREVDPLSGHAAVREADLLAGLGRHDEAVALYSQIIQTLPSDSRARFGLSEVQRKQGRFQEAIRSRKEAHAAVGDHTLDALFVKAAGSQGLTEIIKASAGLQLDRLIAREGAGGYVSPLEFGRTFAQLGETSRAFTSLDAAFEERAAGLVFLGMDPAWDNIRSDSRFSATVRRVGMIDR